ncbi:hypothetical protein PspLS_05443 [Pyricularia sp. CBS 133598]|nr:hypothetical protein PspLS_05443 [Pyricularia sp. CBS 133598]
MPRLIVPGRARIASRGTNSTPAVGANGVSRPFFLTRMQGANVTGRSRAWRFDGFIDTVRTIES